MQNSNLFILHTHYNLILACSLVRNSLTEDRNDLILHAEFDVSPPLKTSLEKVFDTILYVQSSYIKKNKTLSKERYLYQKYQKFKKHHVISKQNYTHVFLSQEDYIDTLIARDISVNKPVAYSYIEDGVDAYFSINSKLNSLNRDAFKVQNQNELDKRSLLQKTLSVLKKQVYGKNTLYENIYCYGMNSNYSDAYVLFPDNVRNEILHTQTKEIEKQALLKGLDSLYHYVAPLKTENERVIVIFFDLINRIPNEINFDAFLSQMLAWAGQEKVQIMYKYHPRESESYPVFETSSTACRIDKSIPSEKVLLDFEGKQVTVIGNLSTSIIVAKKIEFKAICIAKILGIKNLKAFEFFENIGIEIPPNFTQLLKTLETKTVHS